MIPLKDQEAIRVKFAQEMLGPVKIDYFTQKELEIVLPGREPCAYCKPTREMLREVAALSDRISL
ncbi:MAG: glutaredoxin, partial [Chloroflexi bacterium]|nr:glutaredoxin [Chloroflexota bacterium]